MKPVFALALSFCLCSCGTVNNMLAEKTKTVEYYRIFDIKTSASKEAVVKAASDGLGRNVNKTQEATPVPATGEIPEKPGRFTLVNPLQGSKLAALANAGGSIGLRVATCEGAVWSATALRDVERSRVSLTACLFQYKEGYHLDLYAVFIKHEGGANISKRLGEAMAYAAVGTPEQWTEKTMLDVVRSIQLATGAKVTFVEGQPAFAGLPPMDDRAGVYGAPVKKGN